MKRILLPLLMLFIAGAIFSCKKKETETETPYSCATCSRTPQALAANDNIAKGIYKGTVTGSSGFITFDLANSGSTMTATLTIDGVTANLTAPITYNAGQPIVGDFTGTMAGQPVTVSFSVAANGSTPIITSSNIPGHPNAVFTIYKETSNSLIEVFEGTYTKPSSSGTETGVFNIILGRAIGGFHALSKRNGGSSTATHDGTYSNGTITVTGTTNGQVTGTVTNDNVNGTIVDQYGSGSFTGHRTL
ncbi:MAG: hypothetical protein EOO15_00495 [Chitinophagaceae bacterium]|nr:MAG: hypothetical protein EOO15_00495 [Chitinophagaceae bacterium]